VKLAYTGEAIMTGGRVPVLLPSICGLTMADRDQVSIYRHRGFWACMDTQRDREALESL
jgi:hypothetical protein